MSSKIKVDNISDQGDNNLINKCGSTITLGANGNTIELASGASQTGFGRTGTVDWQTGSIKTSTFTATNGEGYFCNTTSGSFTVNLPAGSAGAIVSVQDYNNTFDSNALTITPNGSEKINGGVGDINLTTEGEGLTLVYIDSTVGWRSIQDSSFADVGANFITATGGNTIATCGDFKIHVFTGPGTFCVSAVGNPSGSDSVDYLVVAGGGGSQDGGGGAGGFRISGGTVSGCYTVSPLGSSPSPVAAIPVSIQGYPIVVGGGGAGYPGYNPGSVSSFSTISSAGGGAGNSSMPGASGGGKGGSNGSGGTGNTPPVSPPQGNDGGASAGGPQAKASGGGGAGASGGTNNTGNPSAGAGGAGSYTAIYNHPSVGEPGPVSGTRYFAGGGGGGGEAPTYAGGAGGVGGGGEGKANSSGNPIAHGNGQDATANMGGGGGGVWWGENGNGGSGIVIIRYKYQ